MIKKKIKTEEATEYELRWDAFFSESDKGNNRIECPNCEKNVVAKEVTIRSEKYYECSECHTIWGVN